MCLLYYETHCVHDAKQSKARMWTQLRCALLINAKKPSITSAVCVCLRVQVFARWTDYVASKKARRHTKVQESTAYVHWSTRLLVRCLACWEMAVRERWHAHRVHRVCRRALREWRDVAEEARRDPHGRANMRRRLRYALEEGFT